MVMESFLGRGSRKPVLKTSCLGHYGGNYRNSSIFLMIRRSLPGGGDRGSATRDPNRSPCGPSSSRQSAIECERGGARNPVVRGEKRELIPSGMSCTKTSVLAREHGPPSGRHEGAVYSDYRVLPVGPR